MTVAFMMFSLSSDGMKFFVIGVTLDKLEQYSLSVAWDLSTATFNPDVEFYFGAQEGTAEGFCFSIDGTKLFIVGFADYVLQYSLSTAWDITTASYDNVSYYIGGQDNFARSLFINKEGTKLYIAGHGSKSIHQYSLSTAWDISTMGYDNKSFNVSADFLSPYDVEFSDDGFKMYVGGTSSTTKTIYQI